MSVFIAIALSLAEAKEAEAIYLGINAIDYSGYPGCRPKYVSAYQQLATLSSKAGIEGKAPRLVAPLVMDSKADIVQRALQLGGLGCLSQPNDFSKHLMRYATFFGNSAN